MAADSDVLVLIGGDQAWLDRVKRALGWNEKLGMNATANQVVARLYKALDHLRVFEEEKHGIDPTTGADTPTKLLAQIVAERTAKEAAEAEVARLTAKLEAKLTEPIATIVW